jgi:fucose 4-O-acetylase-like acetyltransferase
MGVMLIGIGYLLVLPGRRLIDLPYVTTDGWYQVLGVNILQLIGVTLIAFVMIMEKSTSTANMRRRALITIAVILALSPVMHLQAIHEHLPMWLRPYLTMKYGSLFPLFPISAYLFVGAILGTYLSELPEEQRGRWLMRSGFRIALPIALVMYGIQQYLMARGVHWHYLSSSNSEFLVLARSAVAMVCIGVSVLLLRITWPLRNTYVLFGKKGLYIYVLHIVVLFGTPWWDGVARGELKSMTISSALTTLAIVLGSTLAITYGVYRYEQAAISVSTRQTIRRVLLGALMIQLALGL